VFAVHHRLVIKDEVLGKFIQVLLRWKLQIKGIHFLLVFGGILLCVACSKVVGSVLLGVIA
jgi:hypothetical protein